MDDTGFRAGISERGVLSYNLNQEEKDATLFVGDQRGRW
jgi:hypothetical protein